MPLPVIAAAPHVGGPQERTGRDGTCGDRGHEDRSTTGECWRRLPDSGLLYQSPGAVRAGTVRGGRAHLSSGDPQPRGVSGIGRPSATWAAWATCEASTSTS